AGLTLLLCLFTGLAHWAFLSRPCGASFAPETSYQQRRARRSVILVRKGRQAMKRIVWPLLVSVSLFGVSAGQSKPYSNRWVRISSNLREDSEVDRIRKIVETAAQHGLTGVALSAGLELRVPEKPA